MGAFSSFVVANLNSIDSSARSIKKEMENVKVRISRNAEVASK